MKRCVFLVLLIGLCDATIAGAETYAVRVVRDLRYLEGTTYPDGKDTLDLYLPDGRRNAPVIVWYYGNLLMGGDKNEEELVGRRFASAGFVTAVVNYRLSPDVSHPAHVQDAAASFAWVKRHITEYGGDASRVYASGYSAGAISSRCSRQMRATSRRTSYRRATSAAWRRSARSTGWNDAASHPIVT